MSVGMSPFKALYGYKTTSFGNLIIQEIHVLGSKDFIQQSMDIMKTLKDNLHQAQNQQNICQPKQDWKNIWIWGFGFPKATTL